MRVVRVQGISLPFEGRQQIIVQYADDTSFTLFRDKEKVRCLVYLLEMFCLATGLVLNWMKSSGYWKQKGGVDRPPWTDMLSITWADEEGVSKLLGAPFGLSLATKDVDSFLLDKLSKKLVHWSTTKLNPTGESIVANSVLLSSTFFFLSIWGGSEKGVKKNQVCHYELCSWWKAIACKNQVKLATMLSSQKCGRNELNQSGGRGCGLDDQVAGQSLGTRRLQSPLILALQIELVSTVR